MTRGEKARRIGAIPDEPYPSPVIPPDHRHPFTLSVAPLLSFQGADRRVNEERSR